MKKSNMYDWVGMRWNPLAGECPHKCIYCSTKFCKWTKDSEKYKGQPRLWLPAMKEHLWEIDGKPVFVCSQNDLFADGIDWKIVYAILEYCGQFPDNIYVFQTKNPLYALHFIDKFPPEDKMIIGTTIETNRDYPIPESLAPRKRSRFVGIKTFADAGCESFITIEPVLDFDVDQFVKLIVHTKPAFVNIGADSKGCGLPEPTPEKIRELIAKLQAAGITIKNKSNLARLLK